MIEFKYYKDIPKNFTGFCKLIIDESIVYYKDGLLHREDGPAVEHASGHKEWLINGFNHREDGPAVEYADGDKCWFYKDKIYGYDNDFTNETWKEKVKEMKRKEELEIFK